MATKERRMKLVCPNVWNCSAKKNEKNTRYYQRITNSLDPKHVIENVAKVGDPPHYAAKTDQTQ